MFIPPPPPPPVLGGPPPPPPPPPGGQGGEGGLKIVPGLGVALHQAMRKISGVEETPACAEGVSTSERIKTTTPTGTDRPKAFHGSQVPGKPKINRAIISEMQSKLAQRRDKVDKEAYVSASPDTGDIPPSGLPPQQSDAGKWRKSSTPSNPSQRWTPPVDYGSRRTSIDCTARRPSMELGQGPLEWNTRAYQMVSVDQERKEELSLAKAVRKSSVKMLSRSPVNLEPSPNSKFRSNSLDQPKLLSIPPPSSVVLRYWNQCSGGEQGNLVDDGEGGSQQEDSEESKTDWKTDALEGEVTEFPSIRSKIANMEEEATKKSSQRALFEVPDVKFKMRQGAPAASWMEARGKLQKQLDTLITKTSAKMAKFGNIHVRETEVEEVNTESKTNETLQQQASLQKINIDSHVKTLIKSVANDIQKSFSHKAIPILEDNELSDNKDDQDDNNNIAGFEIENKERHCDKILRQPIKIDVEAPILDFELAPEEENDDHKVDDHKTESEDKESYIHTVNPDIEPPVDFDCAPPVLDASAALSKAKLIRKSSNERRLPASVLAKKKAAEKLKVILQKVDPERRMRDASNDPLDELELLKKELIDKNLQCDISNTEFELESLTDDQKAELLAKHISKMESGYVVQLLKTIEKGTLDLSVPLLLPFLSLQVRMNLGVDIFKELGQQSKKKVVRESFINNMIEDITDIAILQEVIERSQEKLVLLSAEDEKKFALKHKLVNVENDSFELPSFPIQSKVSPVREVSVESMNSSEVEEEEIIPVAGELTKSENVKGNEDNDDIPSSTVNDMQRVRSDSVVASKSESYPTSGVEVEVEIKKSDDEGFPSSESDTNSDDDKEDTKKVTEENKNAKENIEKTESPNDKSDEDEGIGKETDKNEAQEHPKEKEGAIKQRIMNIINDAKTMDQKRNTARNFGRTFEFQQVQLRPVVQNDRRPAKAKRMDNLWSQVTKSKETTIVNTMTPKPKTTVPWTMKSNPQPQKKEVLAANKEVGDFEACRDRINKSAPLQSKEIKCIETDKVGQRTLLKSDEIKEEKKPLTKHMSTSETKTKATPQGLKVLTPMVEDRVDKDPSNLVSSNESKSKPLKISEITTENKIQMETEAEVNDEKTIKCLTRVTDIEKVKNKSINEATDLKRNNGPSTDSTSSLGNKYKIPIAPGQEKKEYQSEEKVISTKESDDDQSGISISSEDEWSSIESITKTVTNEVRSLTQPLNNIENVVSVAEKEVPRTPIVRRRGDSVVIPLPKSKPPPPPVFRPPPPPMSPPVPASKVMELKEDNKNHENEKQINKETEIDSSNEESESESEWEWSEEEESECEVVNENWENIMSSSQKPTTFKAEYSLRLGGK